MRWATNEVIVSERCMGPTEGGQYNKVVLLLRWYKVSLYSERLLRAPVVKLT